MAKYWFARYTPGPNPGRGLAVISWQGGAVIAGFVGSMVVGAGLFVVGMLINQIALGIGLWVVCVIVGAGTFIWAATTKSDPARSAYDYQNPHAAAAPDRLAAIEASVAAVKDELSKLRADLTAGRRNSGDLN